MSNTVAFHAGLRLRRTREFRGLSQLDLARMLGIGVDGLDRLEQGAAPLDGAVLSAAGKALGVDPSFFFKRLKRGAGTIAWLDWVEPRLSCVNDNVDEVERARTRPGPAIGADEAPPGLCHEAMDGEPYPFVAT